MQELLDQGNTGTLYLEEGEEIIFGRSLEHSSILINDPAASRKHFSLTVKNEELILKDLMTKNGTFIDNVPLIEPVSLQENSIISVGQHLIHIIEILKTYTHTYEAKTNSNSDPKIELDDQTKTILLRRPKK